MQKGSWLTEEAFKDTQGVLSDGSARKHGPERLMAGSACLVKQVRAQAGQRVEMGPECVSPGSDNVGLIDGHQPEATTRCCRYKGSRK